MKKLYTILIALLLVITPVLKVNAETPDNVSIVFVGDILMHTALINQGYLGDDLYDYNFIFDNVYKDIVLADIAIVNQETIFTKDRNNYSSYPMFGSPIEVGDAEFNAGFDIVAHATNHTIDKGIDGIKDTLSYWGSYGHAVQPIGIHRSAEESDILYYPSNNILFAFVNYTYGLNGLESRRVGNEYMVDMLSDDDIEETLAEAEDTADMTIAVLHIGEEYRYTPTEYQMNTIDKFIDNGADIIFCAHPHVVEPYETRTTKNGNTAVVFYSVGNFISAQDEVPRCLGGMAKVTVRRIPYSDKVAVCGYTMIPLVTHQEKGSYTTYKLADYTDELASKHRLSSKGLSVDKLWSLWNDIIG